MRRKLKHRKLMKIISDAMVMARKQRGLTRSALSKLIGCSYETVMKLETNQRDYKISEFVILCNYYGFDNKRVGDIILDVFNAYKEG